MIKKIVTRTKMSKKRTTDPMEDLRSELLPGMDNEVTLKDIVPKVPWRDSHSLRALNSTWQRAFRSGLVYDARVRSQATEKSFVAVCNFSHGIDHSNTYKLYLYSSSQDCWYKLPPIPGYSSGLPYNCKCVPLDGKVYVLGGRKHPSDKSGIGEVYVLDLAGQVSQWEQCESMQVPRCGFGVSVMDGMIFVFGGESGGRAIHRCEKYDPKADVWSETQPRPSIKYIFADSSPYAVGKELFLFGRDVDIDVFQGLHLLVGLLGRDHPRNDEGEDPSVNDDDDPSEDEAEDPVIIGDDGPSGAEETEDPFIREHESGDKLHDVTWIKLIDPDLFRDDDSDNIQWFLEDIKFKHGFHEIIEEQGVRNFDEEIKYEREEIWDELRDVTSYLAYDTCDDKWREVDNVSRDGLKEICLSARPMRAPLHFVWEMRQDPLSYVVTDLWPLDL